MDYCRITEDVVLGRDVKIWGWANLYGCQIGDETRIGTFVEVQKNAVIGKRCKIESHTFVCEGVHIEDDVFVGHGVMFTNVYYPWATNRDGRLETEDDWAVVPTYVKKGASIGSGSVIVCGTTIGARAVIGAGAVVTRDVPAGEVWVGNPARFLKKVPAEAV